MAIRSQDPFPNESLASEVIQVGFDDVSLECFKSDEV